LAIEAFRAELLRRGIPWREDPLEAPGDRRLRLRAWNPAKTLQLLVEAYDVPFDPEFPDQERTHASVVFLDALGDHLVDTSFGVSYYEAALKLIDDVVCERFVIGVVGQPGQGHSSILLVADQVAKNNSLRRSWLGTYDSGAPIG
jgi:hypothetical protein